MTKSGSNSKSLPGAGDDREEEAFFQRVQASSFDTVWAEGDDKLFEIDGACGRGQPGLPAHGAVPEPGVRAPEIRRGEKRREERNGGVYPQVFFCGGDKDEFDKWKRGLSDLAKTSTKRKVENTLKIEIDDDAFDRLYGFCSHPIPYKTGKKVAVRAVSQFGEESTKILVL